MIAMLARSTTSNSYDFDKSGDDTSNSPPLLDFWQQSVTSWGTMIAPVDLFAGVNALPGLFEIPVESGGFASPDVGEVAPATDSAPTVHFNISQAATQITRNNAHWGSGALGSPVTISFGFATSGPSYSVSGHNTSAFSAFSASEQAAARAALQFWSEVSGITFTDQGNTNNATILFRNYNDAADGSQAFAYRPINNNQTATNWEGDVFMNLAFASTTINPGSYDWLTMIHEIGHALGLEHPGAYNAAPGVSITYNNNAEYIEDSRQYTVMSYFSQTNTGASFSQYNLTPALDDIAAIQRLYGVNNGTRTGNNTYGFNSNVGGVFALTGGSLAPVWGVWDAGGTDTFDFSGFSSAQTIDLRINTGTDIGYFSSVGGQTFNVSAGPNVVIENAIGGSGNDTFFGNNSNNSFTGNGGTDTVVFNGSRAAFNFTEFDNYIYTVSGNSQGTDTLNSIERFQFTDITVTDDMRGGVSTTGTLTVDSVAAGAIQFAGDRDWRAVTLQGGHNYIFQQRGAPTGSGTLADTFMRIHNSAGTLVASNDDGGVGYNSRLAVHISGSGPITFYLNAGAFSFGLGTYQVSVEEVETTRFENAQFRLSNFGPSTSGGWSTNEQYPRDVADVDGDGRADVIGFGSAGVVISLANNDLPGGLASSSLAYAGFGADAAVGGWSSQDVYRREIEDINGDGRSDIVGFGADGVYVAGNIGGISFGPTTYALNAFGSSQGWTSDNIYHRTVGDVTGDGMADIVGFGSAGVYVAAGIGSGQFASPTLAYTGFGVDNAAGGWATNDLYPRQLYDLNGDGKKDIIGFGDQGIYVALATGSGTNVSFGPTIFALNSFGASVSGGGWTSNNLYTRMIADINGDNRGDVVGFGSDQMFYALGNGDGTFGAVVADIYSYGASAVGGGWSNNNRYQRLLGDIDGDNRDDVFGFGDTGVYVSRSSDFFNI